MLERNHRDHKYNVKYSTRTESSRNTDDQPLARRELFGEIDLVARGVFCQNVEIWDLVAHLDEEG